MPVFPFIDICHTHDLYRLAQHLSRPLVQALSGYFRRTQYIRM